ncbi:MAG: PilZ domain-containing protein [Gammaproteobacteria bacterium]
MQANDKATREMRKKERFDVTDVVRVIDKPTGRDIGQLVNISEDGIMIMGSEPIAENSIMQLSLVFDGKPDIKLGVESLWSNSSGKDASYWTGFYIIDISAQDQERISHMLTASPG